MKKIFLVLVLMPLFLSMNAKEQYTNEELGFEITLPDNWEQVPVIEANKNMSAIEAIRNDNNGEYLTFVIYPSSEPKVQEANLNTWSEEIASAFGTTIKSIKKTEFFSSNGTDWYMLIMSFGDNKLITFHTVVNGFSYSLSFLTDKPKDKYFDTETRSIAESVFFSRPNIIDKVKTRFETTSADATTAVVVPQLFSFTNKPEPSNCAPYAYSLYQNLLKAKNTQFVLVSDSAKYQLFCLNVILNQTPSDNASNQLISKFVGNKFKEDGAKYEEIFVGPFEQSPEKVYLHKFRLTKTNTATSHYIFYCTKGDQMNIIKIQCPQYFESELEESFYKLILKNL